MFLNSFDRLKITKRVFQVTSLAILFVVVFAQVERSAAAPEKESLNLLRGAQWDAILKLQDQVRSAQSQVFNDKSLQSKERSTLLKKLDTVSTTLSCMKRRAFSVKYKDVAPDGNSLMHVRVLSILGMIDIATSENIFIHPMSYETAEFSLVGLTLHELSHHCGTDDHKYYTSDLVDTSEAIKHLDKLPQLIAELAAGSIIRFILDTDSDWSKNADHYRMWGEYGFCVPDYNCKIWFTSLSTKLNLAIGYYIKAEKTVDAIESKKNAGAYREIEQNLIERARESNKEYLEKAVRGFESKTGQTVDRREMATQIYLLRRGF